jgi:RNA polymerase sigma factor (sigma-70 family)
VGRDALSYLQHSSLGQLMPPDISTADLAEFLTTHGPLLARLHAESGAARWNVSREDLAEAFYRSASSRFAGRLPDGEAIAAYLGALRLPDLALACALRKGSAAAWEEFVASYRPVLYAAARAIVGPAGEVRARELADSLYAELYGLDRAGGTGEGPRDIKRRRPLLDYFHGRSKFSTWLRAVLAQRHVDTLRATQYTESLDEPLAPIRPPARAAGAVDPDRARLLPRLRQAISSALAAVAPAERLLLSLYYLQDMTLAQIARLQSVHEATISRQLDRIRRDLRENVEHSLAAGRAAENGNAAQPGFSAAEVELCFAYAVEDWSFDLRGALSGKSRPAQEEL